MIRPVKSDKFSSASGDRALLEKEYFHLHSTIESFDAKSLTIKAWSVSLAGVVASSGAFSGKWQLLLFAALVSLMFWLIDTAWKTFQYANYRRIAEIEDFMLGRRARVEPLQIARSWYISYRAGGLRRFLKIMFWGHVVLPHGAMCVGLLSAYFVIACTF
jgi:hypothetical protein